MYKAVYGIHTEGNLCQSIRIARNKDGRLCYAKALKRKPLKFQCFMIHVRKHIFHLKVGIFMD